MVFPTLTSPCSCIPWIHCQSNKTHLLVLHSRRPQQLSFDSTDGVVKISENAQEKTYHSKQKKCRVTYLLQLPTFAVDECSSLLEVICILIAAWMIDFIVDFCSSLKTYPCTLPVYCTSAVHECRITRHCPKAIPFTAMHTSFHSRDVRHGTTGWDKQMVSRVSVSTKVLAHIHTDHT